ncbi:jg5800 [Pararge aegeria aegeria]|uniref:Jg5800 protein n=1 Tax=Pararge aegeria aegeria TaxID=348720 RepID=A0A8S4R1R0_9NEOP|nr:jg5800 [Pararge aegeria aegeria]
MAPALTVPPQFARFYTAVETDKLSHRRRALASVDNRAIQMDEDDMGLQNQPSLAKDSQEMEQILVDLGNSDIVQTDLFQAIKTLETGADNLSTGDPEAIFPLSGFDLADSVDSEGDAAEDKIRLMQVRLERRCAFLLRRLRILQGRAIGKRISEEAAQTFEKSTRGARKDGGGRPMGLKALLKRIETTAALQASAASRTVVGPTYYKAGTSKGDASRSASIGISSGTLTGLDDSAGALRSHLSVVNYQLDSDATASSSGAESNDEAVTYNNVHQQPMPIEKRALWTWQKTRASIASRWCWLQVQVQELEYKIRQHNDLHRQVLPTSVYQDVSPDIHMAALSSRPWFRSRVGKAWRGAHHASSPRGTHHAPSTTPQATPRPVKRLPTRLKRGRPPLSRKVAKERDRDEDTSTSGQDRRGRSSTEWRSIRRQSYDIDNIVIPQSVAASTRPEILTYKEIITPKWRVMEIPETPLNNGVMKSMRMSIESEVSL